MQSADRKFPFVTVALQTGSGAEQSIPHGLQGIPDDVWCNMTDTAAKTYTMGTHTATHIKITVTNGATYRVHAGYLVG